MESLREGTMILTCSIVEYKEIKPWTTFILLRTGTSGRLS
jgi:hypothetical protein